MTGMKLREFKFNDLWCRGLSIFKDGKEIACGFIGEVLREPEVIACADREIVSTNQFFDIFVIRV